jgi:hypothetical protein
MGDLPDPPRIVPQLIRAADSDDARTGTESARLSASTIASGVPPLWSMVTVAFLGRAFLLYFGARLGQGNTPPVW